MIARIDLYRKAEEELYGLDRSVKAKFYDFCHQFRQNPDHPGLDLKPLKGDRRIFRAKIDQSYRALLARIGKDERGQENWLVVAVRHRKHVYEELSVAINRITGEIEFVDLAVVGDSVLRRAGVTLTPAEPEPGLAARSAAVPASENARRPPKEAPLLQGITGDNLRDLGVAEQLIELALAVTDSDELDQLLAGAPLLSKDIVYGLAAGMKIDEVRAEITEPVEILLTDADADDMRAALKRTKVTSVDAHVQDAIEQGDFRAWKVFLHPTQAKLVTRDFNGPARVSGGPGTGKTIVALHRVKYLADNLSNDTGKSILLTTFTKNLATDLRKRLASLLEPAQLDRVEITHIDQLAARVLSENTMTANTKQRIHDSAALSLLRQILVEVGEQHLDAEFLLDEWDQVILGQSLNSRKAYFEARRAGRGRSLTRPDRNRVWQRLELFTARLNKEGLETWSQAAERAARYEMARAAAVEEQQYRLDAPSESSGGRYNRHRYEHIVVDEAQDLRASHWKMLRAMVARGRNDVFIAGDTHQRIYDHQVTLGTVGVNIRGRSTRLTLSYRTTKEIITKVTGIVAPEKVSYDDLDDGTDTLHGYRSILHGERPQLIGYSSLPDEFAELAATLRQWRDEVTAPDTGTRRYLRGEIAVCVANQDLVDQVIRYLIKEGMTCAELTKDGTKGDGEIHVGTMHRFKGLEYQKLAIASATDGIIPRTTAIERYRTSDPHRYAREERKARSLLFVAGTRARDTLRISWHGTPSRYLPLE
ncbi:UvrD-helicase domain-containing protein [Nocardia xishanensis]|uniref:UvrD-helicase domain-containing protein n=1 Tax=Nocardia xishanensis TaxID=238964 RepID=UPI0033F34260